jgi:hypothetical protein
MFGKGSVLLDIFDANGNPTGFQHLGNATKFEIQLKDEVAEQYQSLNKSVTLIASALKKRQGVVSITGTDFSSLHGVITQMAAAKTSLATTATAITNDPLISAAATANCKGRYFKTGTPNIGTWTDLKQNSVALTLNTDYVVADMLHGIIYIPLTSGIDTTGTLAVTADYTPLAGSFDQVAAATVPFQRGHIHFVPDPVDGQKISVDIWQVNLRPNGQMGLIADDYGNWELEGDILDNTAATPSAPFYQLTYF